MPPVTSEAAVRRDHPLLVVVALAACGHRDTPAEDEAPATATVRCAEVATATVDDVIEVTGVIAPPPQLDALLSSPIAGRISRVEVEEGDRVAAGALLATIDDPALSAGSIEATAAVASARASKAAAEQELARQQRLVDSGIGARRDLEEARAKAAAAAAELDAANARSGLASRNQARREVRAPHAGVVLHLWKRVGENVDGTTATPIAEVADITTLELRAQATPAVLARIRDGMPATVTLVGIDGSFPARVARVAPAVDPATLIGSVRIAIEGTHVVAVGSAGAGEIVVGQHPGLLVPSSALRRSMVGDDEVVVCAAGVARVRAVTVRRRRGDVAEIERGLTAGEQVVTDHVLGLEEGQPLAPVERR